MKHLSLLFILSLTLITRSFAEEPTVIAGYDYYKEPNNHNYEDAWGFTLGVQHDIAGNLKGQVLYKHITDVVFPSEQDVKGAWGELRGHIPTYAIKYDLPCNERFGFYLTSGVGYAFWDFRENPYLQERNVTVDAKDSIVIQFGIGVDASLGNDWHLDMFAGWFDTDIEKDITRNEYGIVNILDSGDIGLQFIPVSIKVRKKF